MPQGIGLPVRTFLRCLRVLLSSCSGDENLQLQGLPWLLEKFPKAQLGFHEAEAPFVTGGHQYKELKGDTLIFELGKYTQAVDSRQPQHRSVVFKVWPS